jgi:hypothetical protein
MFVPTLWPGPFCYDPPLETQVQKSCIRPEPPCCTCWQMHDDLCRYTAVKIRLFIISWRMPSRMRERICEMSYSSLSSNKTQFLVCNFATGWMKLVSGGAVGRKESESERWAVHMIVKTLGSAWLLLEIHWQKGRQADRPCTCMHTSSANLFSWSI